MNDVHVRMCGQTPQAFGKQNGDAVKDDLPIHFSFSFLVVSNRSLHETLSEFSLHPNLGPM
jgi:hypothetical protein